MLRFNWDGVKRLDTLFIFQYILCYGSTETANEFEVHYIISIHPMLRFNGSPNVFVNNLGGFQYILCYGSTLS